MNRARLVVLPLVFLLGCATEDGDKVDGGGPAPDLGQTADQTVKPDIRPAGIYRVAAVQYTSGAYATVEGCKDDLCALTKLTEQAAGQGAQLVATPEYATDQTHSELAPNVGDKPGNDDRWKDGTILKTYAKLADRLDITSVFNLITQDGPGDNAKLYNTSVAVGPDGKVLARHYKFELFGGESKQLTVAPNINSSFFHTPVGRAGMMICADAQCIVTNLNAGPSCSDDAVGLLKQYFSKQNSPRLVVFSAYWTVGGTGAWGAMQVQQKVAKDANAWFVGANTISGSGKGGGIWKPGGAAMKTTTAGKPEVVIGDIPLN